ncbi:MAG: hypothetical protein H6745_23665 [Deltaproteobacteria bacterium]|nr:hypothetical protein [Deltaproteobacteria bacterium]
MSLRPLAATALLAAAALAGDPARAAAPDLPEVGDVDAQLALDVTPVPEGMGAIFVPSATRPELEPVVHVFAGDAGADRVATAPTGRRIPVPPGAYAVTVGQGPPEWRPRVTVTVEAGKTAVAPAFFGAVRVLAIDRYDHAVDTPYSVVSADGARVYGPERTSDSAAYRATRTWLLAPGNYYLVPGGDPDALDGRIALPVAAGARLAYRLVLDDAERVVRTEFPDRALVATESLWRLDWVLGGSFAFDRAENELAGFSGDALRLGAFTRLEVGVDAGDHLGVFKLGLDEDFVGLEHAFGRGLPFQKLTDLVTAEILYNYRLAEIVGPYVRVRGRTSFFATKLFPEDDATVTVQGPDGVARETFDVSGGDELGLMGSFSPAIVQESAGIGVTAWEDDVLSLRLRGGVAARQQFYGDGGRYLLSHADGAIVLRELDDVSKLGVEASVGLRLRFGSLLSIASSFDAFSAFSELGGSDDFRPVFFWDSAATLRLNTWATLVYQIVVHRDDSRLDDLQIRQSLNLRFQVAIF